jgi:mannitol/fructose-specific phosphotransferase system IIA component (Ntr-type)
MDLTALLTPRIGIECLRGETPEDVFAEIADALVASGGLPKESRGLLAEAFLERERRGTTAFGFGVAIPHVFLDTAPGVRVVVARHPTGIDMGGLDGQDTELLVCVVAKPDQRDTWYALLRALATTLRDRQWRRFILQAPDTDVIYETLIEAGTA